MPKARDSKSQYFNGIRKTKPLHDEIERRFRSYVSKYKIQGETELIYTILEDFLNRQGLTIDESRINRFWENHLLIFDKEGITGKISAPTTLSEYVERTILDNREKRECYDDIFECWFKFQQNILNVFFSLDNYPSYIEFLLDSGRLVKEPQFQELNALFLSNPENRPQNGYEFFRKRFASETFFFLKAGDVLTNTEQIRLERFVDFLPAMAELIENNGNTWFSDIITPKRSESEYSRPGSPLWNWFCFLSCITGKLDGEPAPFSLENLEEAIKEDGEPAIKGGIRNVYYSLTTQREIPIKHLKIPVSLKVVLKVVPGVQRIIDFDAFFDYLWNTKKITRFLEKICVYSTSDYFGRFLERVVSLLRQGSDIFEDYLHGLESFHQFLTKLGEIPASRALQWETIKMDLFKRYLQVAVADEKLFPELYGTSPDLACLQKPNPLISIWEQFAQVGIVKDFLSRKVPQIDKIETFDEMYGKTLERIFKENPDFEKYLLDLRSKNKALRDAVKKEES